MNKDAPKNEKQVLDDTGLDVPEVEKSYSPVATMPGRNVIAIGVAFVVVLFLVYQLFLKPSKDHIKQQPQVNKDVVAERPTENLTFSLPEIPSLPQPPSLVAPPVVETPVPAPVVKNEEPKPLPPTLEAKPAPAVAPVESAIVDNKINPDRLKSNIVLYGAGGGDDSKNQTIDKDKQVVDTSNDFKPATSTAPRVKVTNSGDMRTTIVQGKFIDAVLETAINSDLSGPVRAVVSRDVYAEAGYNILIPRGSRIMGTYDANISFGQKRIAIIWNRIIRPDGIDVQVDSPAIDQIGRAGKEGQVNNKFFEIMANTVLLSTINVLYAWGSDHTLNKKSAELQNSVPTSTTTNADGSVTTNQTVDKTATATAIEEANSNISSVITTIGEKVISSFKPTITIDQGEKIKILVNRDLVFPKDLVSGTKIIR